jgi:hypothetical protein
MNWVTWAQIAALILIVYILSMAAVGHVIDKRREDDLRLNKRCAFRGLCGGRESDHITIEEFRALKEQSNE